MFQAVLGKPGLLWPCKAQAPRARGAFRLSSCQLRGWGSMVNAGPWPLFATTISKKSQRCGVERSEHRWIQIGYSNYAGFSVSHERPDHNAKLCKALDLPPAVMGFKSTVSSCLAAKFHVRRTSSKCSTSLRVWSAKAKSLDLQFAAVRRKRHTCISHYRSISVNNSGHATVNLSGVRFHGPDLMGLCTEFNEAMIFSCPKKQV